MSNSPTSATGKPTGEISNMARGGCPEASSRPEITRFVEVPIRVTIPPRIAAKDRGIRYREGEWPERSAQLAT